MNLHEILLIGGWWGYIFIIGLLFLPISNKLFDSFFDKGYILSKTIGILVLTYTVFLLGSIHLITFTRVNIFILLMTLAVLGFYLSFLPRTKIKNNFKLFLKNLRKYIPLFIFEELIFFAALFSWALIRSFQPNIHGIEKFMDFSILNSILRTTYFPVNDPWFSPLPINYYYFGHIYSAVLIKISDIPSNISFNLIISTAFALIFINSFSITTSLVSKFAHDRKLKIKRLIFTKIIVTGLLSSFILTLAGNLQVIYAFFKSTGDKVFPLWQMIPSIPTFPNNYWYPSATRFIYHAIHEFPSYALTLSDLHAHLLDTPFSILFISIAFIIFTQHKTATNLKKAVSINYSHLLFASLIIAVMYMTNAWDSIIFIFLFCFIVGFIRLIKKDKVKNKLNDLTKYFLFIIGFSIIFSLPFSLNFKPFVNGIGLNCSPALLTKLGHIGPFLFEKGYCQTTPIWQFIILYGFFLFFAFSFFIFIYKTKKRFISDEFTALLFASSLILIFIPEVFYLKDIYPDYFRANTIFKISYSSFVILSIASSFAIFRILQIKVPKNLGSQFYSVIFTLISILLFIIVFTYPILALNSYYGNFRSVKGLDGTKYLKYANTYDYDAIIWINKNIQGHAGILEANGNSYSDFGRISVNTGLSNIINWSAHEWLWRGSYKTISPRIVDVETLYTTNNLALTTNLLKKYGITYVYIGDMERKKYPHIDVKKFNKLGIIIYHNKRAVIYKII